MGYIIVTKSAKRLSEMNEDIIELAAEGYSAAKISSFTGIKVEKIKDLLEKEDIQRAVADQKSKSRADKVENKYDRIENLALKRIEDELPMAEIPDLIKVMDVVHKKKVGQNTPPANAGSAAVVNIFVPTRIIPEESKMTTNSDGEIIQVGDRNFAALPTPSLQEMFREKQAKEVELANTIQITAEEM